VSGWTSREKVALSLAVIAAVFLGEYIFNWAQQDMAFKSWQNKHPQLAATWDKATWIGEFDLRITLTYRVAAGDVAVALVKYIDSTLSNNYVRLEAEFDHGRAYTRKEGRGQLISIPEDWRAADEKN
jgi:hypothetical protein